MWVSHSGGATGFVDGRAVTTLGGVTDPEGIGVTSTTAMLAEPATRRLVAIDLASGTSTTVTQDAPIGPAIAGASLPHRFTPVLADGDGFLIGCDGDGSIRRLTRA